MVSKVDLAKAINGIDPDADTADKSHDDLTAMLKELKELETPEEIVYPDFVVGAGHSLVYGGKILKAGVEVRKDSFPDSKAFDRLKSKGKIVTGAKFHGS